MEWEWGVGASLTLPRDPEGAVAVIAKDFAAATPQDSLQAGKVKIAPKAFFPLGAHTFESCMRG